MSRLSIQIIRRHQQLQTQFRRNIHIRDVGLLFHFLVVAEVFADFFEDDAAISIKKKMSDLQNVVVGIERKGGGGQT